MEAESVTASVQVVARGVDFDFGGRFFDGTRLEFDSRCCLSSAEAGGGSMSMSMPMKASLLLSPGSGIASSSWLGWFCFCAHRRGGRAGMQVSRF
jgi:hypothetical protein